MTLFSLGSDSHKEKWEGARTCHHDLTSLFSVDTSLPTTAFLSHLRSLLSLYSHIYIDLPPPSPSSPSRRKPTSILKYLSRKSESAWEYDNILEKITSSKQRPLSPEVSRIRSIKSEAETKIMRAAADISGRAHTKVLPSWFNGVRLFLTN
jgi:intermediate cleaving peptidase 55